MAADLLRELERLPSDWNYAVTRDGRLFFINDRTQSTTWVHPVTGVPIQSGHQPSPGLPAGWEKAVTPDGILYYIDHNCRATTFEHPATNRPLDQSHRTSRSPVGSPRSPTSSQALTHKQNNKSQPKQRNLKAPTAHRDENSRITMRGWLHRQEGASMKTWKRRWCVLADYALFFYKDDTENLCMESILLPSFRISECTQSDNANRRYAFKAKHGNLKTNYFAADRHEDMNRWIEHLQSAASLKAGLGSPTTEKNNTVKFVPKSPIMTWDDDNSSPLSPTSLSSSQFGPGYWSTSNSQQQFQGPERKHSVHNGGPGYHSSREQLARRQQHSPHDGSQDTSPNYPHQRETFPTSDVDRTGGRDSYPWHSDKYHVPPESTVMSSVRYGPTVRSGNENPNYQQKRLYSKHLQQPENRYNDQHHPEQSYRFDPERGSYSRMPGGQDLQRLSYSKQLVDENDPHRQRNSEHTRQFPSSGADTQHLGYPKSKTNRRDPQRSRSEERDLQNRSRRRDEKSLYPVQTGQIGSADQRQSHSRFPDYPSDRNLQGNHQPDSRNSAHAHGFTHSPHLKPHGQNHSPQERQYQRSRSADRLEKPVLQDSRFPSHYAPAVQDRLGQTSFDSPDRRHRSQSEDRKDKSLDNRPAHPPLSGSADNRKTSQNRQDSHYRSRYPEDQYVSSRERRQEPLLSSQHDHKQENSAGFCRQPGSRVLVSSNPSMKDPNSRYIDNRPIDPHYDKYADQQQKPRERTFPHKEEKDRNRYGDAIQRDSESRDVPPTGHHDPHSILDSRRSRGVDSMQNSQEFHSRQHMRSSYSPQQRDSQSNFPDDRNGHQRYSQSGISEDRVSYARLKKPDDPLRHNKDLPDKRDNRGGGSLPHDRNVPVHEKVQYAELIHKQPKPVNIDEESPYAVVRKPWLTQKPEPAVNAQQKSARQREDIEYSDRLSDDKWKERADPLLGAVYDGLDRPESLSTSTEGPVRPPLPAEVHHQIIEDIAHNRSPKTSDDYLQAEQRMKKPSYFEYPSLSSFDAKIGYQEIKVVPAQSQFSDSLRQGRYPGDQQQMDPERRLVTGPIHTVKEEPDMPDTDVIETELRKLSKDPLTTRGLRMSINAGDLIGKTHDELVLLLIQLRRNQSAVEKARDYYRSRLEIKRPAEHQYRRQVIENIGPIDSYLESEHAQYSETRKYCEEVENKLEVYRPLVNLVSNMVTMGSLYGGDNQMMATQYRKHLLSPDQYVPPKKMLEFSRKQQEDKIVKEMEDEVQQLSMEEVDLEDKVDRLCQLDRLIQEYSFKVVTFREDKELLEKALQRILKQQDLSRDNPRDLEHLTHQQRTIEKELTLVMYQLAEASKVGGE